VEKSPKIHILLLPYLNRFDEIDGIPTVADELKQDNEFITLWHASSKKFYDRAMNLAWQQIEPAEMKTIAEQAKKADRRQQKVLTLNGTLKNG
jgi:hypothetical protein